MSKVICPESHQVMDEVFTSNVMKYNCPCGASFKADPDSTLIYTSSDENIQSTIKINSTLINDRASLREFKNCPECLNNLAVVIYDNEEKKHYICTNCYSQI